MQGQTRIRSQEGEIISKLKYAGGLWESLQVFVAFTSETVNSINNFTVYWWRDQFFIVAFQQKKLGHFHSPTRPKVLTMPSGKTSGKVAGALLLVMMIAYEICGYPASASIEDYEPGKWRFCFTRI